MVSYSSIFSILFLIFEIVPEVAYSDDYDMVVDDVKKEQQEKARAGISSLPKIVGMAFGDGGVDSGSRILPCIHPNGGTAQQL